MCVLLVEDETFIREIMAESLQDAGFEVFQAVDGVAAMRAIHETGPRFTIVVTDFHMPGGVDGSQVAAGARALLPHIPVIIASGRPDVLRTSWTSEQGIYLLRKPYLPSLLVATVKSMVGSPST